MDLEFRSEIRLGEDRGVVIFPKNRLPVDFCAKCNKDFSPPYALGEKDLQYRFCTNCSDYACVANISNCIICGIEYKPRIQKQETCGDRKCVMNRANQKISIRLQNDKAERESTYLDSKTIPVEGQ